MLEGKSEESQEDALTACCNMIGFGRSRKLAHFLARRGHPDLDSEAKLSNHWCGELDCLRKAACAWQV